MPFGRIGSCAHLLAFSAIKRLYIIQNVCASGPAEVTSIILALSCTSHKDVVSFRYRKTITPEVESSDTINKMTLNIWDWNGVPTD
jgi:hypothetical protein